MIILSRNPSVFVVLMGKGGELKEAVVKLAGEQADLKDVFENRRGGTYHLRFVPKSVGARARAQPVGPVSVDWEPGGPALITAKGLSPGLYEVEMLSEEDGGRLEPGTGAWVLFTSPEASEGASREFGEAAALTDAWYGRMRPDLKRQFLRAALSDLAARLLPRGATREK